VLKNDATLNNYNRGTQERFQHIQIVQGKQLTEVGDLHAGDIGAIAKLKETTTGETLGDKASSIFILLPSAGALHHFAIEPKTRADEDKIGVSIHKILEEDAALRFMRDPQTKEFLLAGPASSTSKSSSPSSTSAITSTSPSSRRSPLSRNDSRQGRRGRQAQETIRRPRPVRRLPHQGGAYRAWQRRRVRGRRFRRRHSAELDSLGRERYSRRRRARVSRRFFQSLISVPCSMTASTTT